VPELPALWLVEVWLEVLFLKKGTKKLLLLGTLGQYRRGSRMPTSKSFLLLFFKKEDLPSCLW
jgi:hypothetical protein